MEAPRDHNRAGYYPGRSCLVAVGDRVLLIDNADILQLDGETGAEAGRLQGPQLGGQIKWIGAERGRLAALAGDPDTFSTSSLQQQCTNPFGPELAAFDLATGKPLWRATEDGSILIAHWDGSLSCFQ